MTINTILTVLTDQNANAACLEHAIGLAKGLDAHLDVMALGIDPVQVGYAYGGMDALVKEASIGRVTQTANEVAKWAEERVQASGLRYNVEPAVALLSGAHQLVGTHGRFSDVIVVPQPYADKAGPETETLLESALFHSSTPVIVVPPKATARAKPQKIVAGWNDSAQSLAAIKAALPLMREADLVSLTIIDPPKHGADRSDPGGAISQFLARHGVHVEISVLAKTMPRVGDVLMRHAEDFGADMIVSGAYGHTRFREALLGGATRRLLEQSSVPMFMMH
ncbi:universal stress protein [Nereida sp. MMG025]|uniref:universal stress protein n=1 Tax=Nereida sp. MMG025 TaxID=2909981 RepID=UPI001F45ECD6|nr:universal stress protein [Nereida sp. MMG025]MCF6446133.1 universal stress protein [Nereida sp. MMG025]